MKNYSIGILPWLSLEAPVNYLHFSFVPSHNDKGEINEIFHDYSKDIETILAPYLEEHNGKVFRGCTVVVSSQNLPVWNFDKSQFDLANSAIAALFLSGISCNDYYRQYGCYCNDSMFKLFVQRFNIPPDGITITKRRRDGRTLHAGLSYTNTKFSKPYECIPFLGGEVKLDSLFLQALEKCHNENQTFNKILDISLSLFRLANTDNDNIPHWNEAFLLATAFESLLQPNKSEAKYLAEKFSELFSEFGQITVKEASEKRNIEFNNDNGNDWIHKRWIFELYSLRSMIAHGRPLDSRSWTWSLEEHLVMATYVFPLVVKLLLKKEKCYSISIDDEAIFITVDHLLEATEWYKREDSEARWTKIKNERSYDKKLERQIELILEEADRKSS